MSKFKCPKCGKESPQVLIQVRGVRCLCGTEMQKEGPANEQTVPASKHSKRHK